MNPVKRILDKFKWLLAWASLILACTGGLAATGSFVGTWIVRIVQIGPWWLPFLLIGLGALRWLGDLSDGVPNRWAVYISMLWPSLFLAIPDGKMRESMSGWVDDLNRWLDSHLAVWVGHAGANAIMTVTAVTCIGMAVLWAHKYAKDAKASNTTGKTTPAFAMAGKR